MSMQERLQIANNFEKDLKEFINSPPNISIRIAFLKEKLLLDYILDKIRYKIVDLKEFINLNDFFDSDIFIEAEEKLEKIIEKYGENSNKYFVMLEELVAEFILDKVKANKLEKVFIIGDEVLYEENNAFDPIDFCYSYFADGGYFIKNEIPLVWMTIGKRHITDETKIYYYKDSGLEGRILNLKRNTFIDNIKIYD